MPTPHRIGQDRRATTDAVLRNDPDAATQLGEIDQSLQSALAGMRDTNGEALGLSAEWRETERLLAQARTSSNDSAQRNYAAHTELLKRLQSMLQTALERSQLIRDQSVMIHYAVQSGFQQSPALIESLAVMRTLAVSALQRKAVTEEERQLLRGATERVRLYHAELASTLERFLELAPELREPLTESIEQAKQAERFANIERMASSLDRAGASVLDLARSVNEGTTRITRLDSMARQSSDVATTAGRTVDQVVDRIRGIAEAGRRIEEIVATVDSITFQTRLLSLNAAVEAARAGEHGRGFGVVATEVRQLAARSQQASQEIRTLIQSSLAEVGAGTRLAADARAQMQRVVEAAQTLSVVIGEATQAASDQGRAAVQIAPLIQEVQADSERNAERVEQVKEATHSLDSMAQSLKSSMARFQVDADPEAEAA